MFEAKRGIPDIDVMTLEPNAGNEAPIRRKVNKSHDICRVEHLAKDLLVAFDIPEPATYCFHLVKRASKVLGPSAWQWAAAMGRRGGWYHT